MTTLLAALESKNLDLPALKGWADQCIEMTNRPKSWLVDLSMAPSNENALDVLRVALPEYGVILNQHYGELLLGFWYMQLKAGNVSEDEFATECIDIVDAYEVQELNGQEIVKGACSEGFTKSLANWGKRSEENLRRILGRQFNEKETEALGLKKWDT